MTWNMRNGMETLGIGLGNETVTGVYMRERNWKLQVDFTLNAQAEATSHLQGIMLRAVKLLEAPRR